MPTGTFALPNQAVIFNSTYKVDQRLTEGLSFLTKTLTFSVLVRGKFSNGLLWRCIEAMDWQITAAREATSLRRLPKNDSPLSAQKRLCFMGVRLHLVVFGCVFLP